MVYSDIGAYMAGRVLEAVTGQKLDVYLHEHVFEPAGMHDTQYKPPASLLPRIAPTEFDPKRGGLVRGKVHDERAYYLGGVSAHAGLFSDAHDLTRFAQMYLNGGEIGGVRVLPRDEIRVFTTRQVQDRALGWQKPDGNNSAGHLMSRAGLRAHGLHGHVDLDRSTARHLHHAAHQSREPHSSEHEDRARARAARRRRDVHASSTLSSWSKP